MKPSFIGQLRWQQYFEAVVRDGRLGHAYLFSGPAHVGKKTFVDFLTKASMCRQPSDTLESCGACRSCLAWFGQQHPDYKVLISEEAHVGVEEVRGFIQEISHTPSSSPFHIGVIPEAERLTPAALNALLKTLEEPPKNVIIFLMALDIANLPATVRSRIEHCLFAPVANDELVTSLIARGAKRLVAEELASLSRGCPGLALEWLHDPTALAAYQREALELHTLLRSSLAERFAYVEGLATEERLQRSLLERRLDHWLIVLRDGLLASVRLPELVAHTDLRKPLNADRRDVAAWRRAIDALIKVRHDLQASANRRLALNTFFINV